MKTEIRIQGIKYKLYLFSLLKYENIFWSILPLKSYLVIFERVVFGLLGGSNPVEVRVQLRLLHGNTSIKG